MSAKIKCLIVDDEPLAREGLEGYIKQVDFLELAGTSESAVAALSFLKENPVDLIFLDIQMPSLTGLDFVKSLQNPPKIIFTTAYANHALQGFELDAVDYLLKPIPFPRFLKAVNKVAEQLKHNSELEVDDDFFFIKTDKKFIKIKFDEVLYIEGVKDYVKIHTPTERHLVLINIKNIQLRLPEGKFIRVHKSYIVATDKINLIEGNIIRIAGHEIAIGKEYRDSIDDLIRSKLVKRSGPPKE